MVCLQCGYESAGSTGTCPSCGTPRPADLSQGTGTPAGAAAPAGAPTGAAAPVHASAPAQAFSFDLARWTTIDRITGGATVVLFISLFLPWFSASASLAGISASSSEDALSAHGYLYLVLIIALLMVGYLIARAGLSAMPALPVSHERLLTIASGINFLLVLIAFIFKPSGNSLVSVGWDFGAFVGLLAAIVALVPLVRAGLQARRP